jgi:hypothetical protein
MVAFNSKRYMPTNQQLQQIAKQSQMRAAQERQNRSDIVRAMCAVVAHYGGKITINEHEIAAITEHHQLVANQNAEAKEIIFTVSTIETQPQPIKN